MARKRKKPASKKSAELAPENLLHFVELKPFTRAWAAMGLNDESDLTALQREIMANPKAGAVIKGTASIRKIRFAPKGWGAGKSGAVRVLYVLFDRLHIILLAVAYKKGEVDTLSAATKKHFNELAESAEKLLETKMVEWKKNRTRK